MSETSQGGVGSIGSAAAREGAGRDLEPLVAAVAEHAASPLFPALAETYRRLGRTEEARRVAEAGLEAVPENPAGRVALALTLLDLDQVELAREQLAGALSSLRVHPALALREEPADTASGALEGDVEEIEIDRAFESAEAQADEMLDANKLVEQALRREDLHEPEGDFSPLSSSKTYATRTMAKLLERQGDRAAADAVRAALGRGAGGELDAAAAPEALEVGVPAGRAARRDPAQSARILSTLQTWLQNIRRGVA